MDDSDVPYQRFKKQVAQSILVIGVRLILYQVILTLTNFVLARVLNPEIFGTFAIISFFVLNLGIFTNLGLQQALIQSKDEPDAKDIQVFFTVLVSTSILFVLAMYFLAPIIANFYGGKLGPESIFWLRVYAVYILFGNIASVSMTLLDKSLNYVKLTMAELATLGITQVLIIILAINGYGLASLILGNLIGSISGIIIYYGLSPWSFGIHFSFSRLKRFLAFGLNYQFGTLTGAFNAAVIPLFVGTVSGPAAVGFINMAGGIRQAGLAPTEMISKLAFTAGARIQNQT